MALSFRNRYKSQLPRRRIVTVERVIAASGSVASIIALYLVFYPPTDWTADAKATIVTVSVCIIGLGAVFLVLTRLLSKPHRYAQSVYYTHYVNHIIRDFISDVQGGGAPNLNATLEDVANAVAACFSVITAKRCRCAIKEVTPESNIATVARDSASKIEVSKPNPANHPLAGNSDFADV
jgi:hypothetical protein